MTRKAGAKPESSKASAMAPELLAGLEKAKIAATKLQPFAAVEGKQVYQFPADGMEAIRLWEKLRAVVDQTGYWPLVMERDEGVWLKSDMAVDDKVSASWAEGLKRETGRSYDKKLGVSGMIRKAGLDLDANEWLKANSFSGAFDEDDAWNGGRLKARPNTKFKCVLDALGQKPKASIVALWPTPNGWMVPALMRYGGWNSCPMPHVHVALLKRWQLNYAAELVAIAGDVVEFRVGKPPRTAAAAMELAREHACYCDEIVSGPAAVASHAETVMNATVWFFWWD